MTRLQHQLRKQFRWGFLLALLTVSLMEGKGHAVDFDQADSRTVTICNRDRRLIFNEPLAKYPDGATLRDVPIDLLSQQKVEIDGIEFIAADLIAADIARGCDYPAGLACGPQGCKQQDSWDTGQCGPTHRIAVYTPKDQSNLSRVTGCQVERTPVRKREYWEQDE